MSAIYQRARPVRWEDVVGQEHVKDVLKAALEQGRVGHAYLFSGPRGVGKTTTARLIAMTANCTGPLPKPCGECDSCLSVRAGSHPDVMEIDAASNNSVDDVRDLREKVSLAAMHGGKKIYILDEAHMMSRAAFNALLKTLEEPPSHVIFILATTEPEKIIPTILSRCQHYRFRRLTPEEIAGKLGGLVQREGARAEPDALHLIGRLADGAMRDGESLLERMLAAGTAITRAGVEDALGLPPGERVRGIAAALVGGDAGAAISGAAALYRDGFAARTVVEGLVAALGAALHAELGLKDTGPEARLDGADVPRLLKLQAALDEQESRFARAADQQSLELALTHALLAADASSGAAGRPAAGAATGPAASVPADLAQRLNRLEKELASLRARPAAPAGGPVVSAPVADFDPGARRAPAPAAARAGTPDTGGSEPPAPTGGSWPDVLRQASMQLRAFLKPARQHAEPGYVSLSYDERNAFHAKQVAAKFDEIGRIVLSVFGPVTFELIAPEGGRRVKLGGPGGAPTAPTAPAPAPAQASAPVAAADTGPDTAGSGGGVEVAPFDPVRGAPAARRAAPTAAAQASATQAFSTPAPAPVRAPAAVLPEVAPPEVVEAPTPALVAALPPRPERHGPRSPDDVAPAPLPHDPFGGDDPFGTEPFGHPADHAADPPPAPAGAQGGDRLPPAPASRELYIVEPITEEPDWNALGGPYDDSGPLTPVQEGPPAQAPRPAPRPEPAPAAAPLSAAPAPSRPGDIRAHPMYEDIRSRFGGRVREIGKNRNVPPTVTPGDDDTEDADDSDV
ncbi:DNA polymerase III subunit gamma/tau [Deinococcus sp. A31D244]|uniref:DNA polymerase III subunit gamma/tau n=1 Tax=Deinococcus sp. A31D244 TaxID=3397675 RepID=UPI0039E0F348